MAIALFSLNSARALGSDGSFARCVPADVGLFAELRGADDLLISLTEPQVWVTLAELAGQAARPEEVAEWRSRIKQTIEMEPEEAIRSLFARGVAFIGEAPGRAQDAVLLCRPKDMPIPPERLKDWQARPMPLMNRASVYQLRNNIGLAQYDDVVLFGDASAVGGMFPRTLKFAEPERPGSLAQNSTYRALLARAPSGPDGLVFARLRPTAASQPAASQAASRPTSVPSAAPARSAPPELPGPLRGAANVLLALHRESSLLHFTAVGDAPSGAGTSEAYVTDLVEDLPERTLIAWGGQIDLVELLRSAKSLSERNALRVAIAMQERTGVVTRLVDALDSSFCIAIGAVESEHRLIGLPPLPAAALLIGTRHATEADRAMTELLQSSVSVYNLLALQSGVPGVTLEADNAMEGLTVHSIDLSAPLAKLWDSQVPPLQLCWALDGDDLIVATHADWLRQIVRSRHGETTNLSRVIALTKHPVSDNSAAVIAIQSGPIADLGAMWLAWLEEQAPQTLREDWWRERQPGGARVRLGIRGTEDPQARRLKVGAVDPASPAGGILRVGDEIVGCNGRPFATTQPVQEITDKLANRPSARWFDLQVERGGKGVTTRRVPIPFVDPVQVLRRAIAIGKIAQRVVYHDDAPDPAGPRGFLTVELRKSEAPLFKFERGFVPQPVGDEASKRDD